MTKMEMIAKRMEENSNFEKLVKSLLETNGDLFSGEKLEALAALAEKYED